MPKHEPSLTLLYPWNVDLSSDGEKIKLNYMNGPFITGQDALDELVNMGFDPDFVSKIKVAAIGSCLINECRDVLIITCLPIVKPEFTPDTDCLHVTYARIAYYAVCNLVECESADDCKETAYIKDIKKWKYEDQADDQ